MGTNDRRGPRVTTTERPPPTSTGIRDAVEDAALEIRQQAHVERVRRAVWSTRMALAATVAVVLTALGYSAWNLRRSEQQPVTATCTPALTQDVADDDSVSRVDFVASSPDGKRVAVLFSRKLAGKPYVQLVGYQAGVRDPIFHRRMRITEEELHQRTTLVAKARQAPELAEGFNGTDAVQPLRWCASDGHVRVDGRHPETLTWELWKEPCADGHGQTTQWKMCLPASAECMTAPVLQTFCFSQAPRLVGMFEVRDTLWAVVERPMGSDTPRMVAGIEWRDLVMPRPGP